MGGVLLALALAARLRGRPVASASLGALGAILFVAGLAFPTRLGPVLGAWMGLARAISRVTTPLVLAIVYFLVLTPTGLLLRLFGKDPLRRPEGEHGFWVKRSSGNRTPKDMERQF